MAPRFWTVLHLRLRMFLCSSSSVVGLWLRRLKREINVLTPLSFFYFTPFLLLLVQSTGLSASSGQTNKLNFSTDSLLCIICTSTTPTTRPKPNEQSQPNLSWKFTPSYVFVECRACASRCAYLTSLQPICWRSSCLSVSELRGKMFFSSSSFLLGRFPSLMFRVSRRRILLAREPGTGKNKL